MEEKNTELEGMIKAIESYLKDDFFRGVEMVTNEQHLDPAGGHAAISVDKNGRLAIKDMINDAMRLAKELGDADALRRIEDLEAELDKREEVEI